MILLVTVIRATDSDPALLDAVRESGRPVGRILHRIFWASKSLAYRIEARRTASVVLTFRGKNSLQTPDSFDD